MPLLGRALVSRVTSDRLGKIAARRVDDHVPQTCHGVALGRFARAALEEPSPDLLAIMAEGTAFSQREVLGASATADVAAMQRAWASLALLRDPGKGDAPEQRVQVNVAYEQAQHAASDRTSRRR